MWELFPMDQHLQGINGFSCGDEQDVTFFSTEADVGCPVLRNGEMGNLLTILVEYGHAVASQIDIPTVVNRHPIIMKSSAQTRQAKPRANIIKSCASNTTVISTRILWSKKISKSTFK